MSLSDKFSSHFTNSNRSRGQDYFRLVKVRIVKGDDWDVVATVSGTESYRVTLEREENRIFVNCTCEYFKTGGPCKHLWAVLLMVDKNDYLKGDGTGREEMVSDADFDEDDEFFFDEDDDEDDDESVESSQPRPILSFTSAPRAQAAQPTAAPTAPPKPPSWKDQLAALGRTARPIPTQTRQIWPESRRMLYVVNVPATLTGGGLILEVFQQDLKKNGDWAKPKSQRLHRHLIAEMSDPDDREILTMLSGAKEAFGTPGYHYSYENQYYDTLPALYKVSGLLEQKLVPMISRIGRGRLRLQNYSDDWYPIEWDDGEPWIFQIEVKRMVKNGVEQYLLTGLLRRGEERMELATPLLLLDSGFVFTREKAARLDDRGAFPWILLLRQQKAIQAPVEQGGELLTEILKSSALPPLNLPEELRYEEVVVAPRPCLMIKAPERQRWQAEKLRGALSFDYGGKMILGDDASRGLYQAAERRLILRDREAELRAREQMRALGWKYKASDYYDREARWELAPTKLPRVARDLLAAGWHVEAEGRIYRQPGEIKIQVSSGIDWFELHGTVDFGGATAKLPELLSSLKRGETLIKLGDGTFGLLPEEWLRKYGMIAGLGESHDDHLRFRKSQVGVLDALLAAQPEANFDEHFAHARDELKRFAGVEAAEAPPDFIGELRPYQKDGLGWLHFLRQFGFGGCLADDMGLGKTVQVLALLEARRQLREQQDNTNGKNGKGKKTSVEPRLAPALAVVPKSLVFNWKQEAARFTPKLRILDHTGQLRQKEAEHFEDYDLVLTTYGTLRNDAVLFKDLQFDYIILDEAQTIKNADTASAKAARLLRGDFRLALSGTPVENHLGELWSMFEFLNPGMLGGASVFKLTGAGARHPDEETRKVLAQALRPFILRRTKEQVAKDLPPKLEQTIFCELEPMQRKLYNELREHYRNTLLKRIETEGLAKSKMHVLEALLRLRQAACHPGLIDKKRVDESSAKMDLLVPQLVELFEEGHKALVFSQFTSLLAIVRARLDQEGLVYEYLDGKTRDRQARVERFQNDPDCKLFLISLKAGGLGLNLTAAEYVYLLDPWWNPAVEAQAIDRAHRIGQSNNVFAYRLIAKDTVEEKVLELQKTKRDLADAIINADNSLIRGLGREDLELLLS